MVAEKRSPGSIRKLKQRRQPGNENGKNATGLIRKTTLLHVHHAFLYISLLSLHDHDVIMAHFTFYGGRKQATTNFPSLSKLKCGPQEINSKEIRLH